MPITVDSLTDVLYAHWPASLFLSLSFCLDACGTPGWPAVLRILYPGMLTTTSQGQGLAVSVLLDQELISYLAAVVVVVVFVGATQFK